MARPPWTFHADCLREETIKAPAGAHEVLLVMRDNFDLLGPQPGQVVRLVPGAVLYAEIGAVADDRLAIHLAGVRAHSEFRFAVGLMLGVGGMSDQIEAEIDDWIDAHVAVVLLPVAPAPGMMSSPCRYEGVLNGFHDAWAQEFGLQTGRA